MKVWQYILFYILQWTWGIILNLAGAFVALFMLITGHKPHVCAPFIYFKTKWNFGGFSLGMWFIIGENCEHCAPHEMGHSIQNMFLGPLMPFVVAIPSALRYWIRTKSTLEQMEWFTWIVAVIGIIVTVALVVVGYACSILWLAIIGIVLLIYVVALAVWAIGIEIPKYKNGFTLYDSIWIEGYATEQGNKYFGYKWWEHCKKLK